MRLFLSLVLVASACLASEPKNYKDYQVLSVHVPDVAAAEALLQLEGPLSFWNDIRIGHDVDVMIAPDMQSMKQKLRTMGLMFSTKIEDVQAAIDEQGPMVRAGRMDWTSYHSLEDIYEWFGELVVENSDWFSTETIGSSYEGRDMTILKVCSGTCGDKPGMWLQSGIHAREWISPAVNTYMINELRKIVADENSADRRLVDELDWYFLPSVNPDGYDYTHNGDRMWRKTRKPNPGSNCVGTDANRNWDYQWNHGGAGDNYCSETYHGYSALSELETAAVNSYMESNTGKFRFFHDIHSYSQLILLPWGWQHGIPTNDTDWVDLEDVACGEANAALLDVHGFEYECGATADTIYLASGIAVDFGYGSHSIKYTISMELRDTGDEGFLLKPNQIIPNGEEVWAFHKVMADAVINDP